MSSVIKRQAEAIEETAAADILEDLFPETDAARVVALRGQKALRLLLEAYHYAQQLQRPEWDFALTLDDLKDAAFSTSELRWLLCKGFVEHGRELKAARDNGRSFQADGSLALSSESCFVLTARGLSFVRASLAYQDPGAAPWQSVPFYTPDPAKAPVPKWDSDRHQLWVNRYVVKQFKLPAPNQEIILAAFEEEAWPHRIDDPLPPRSDCDPKRRLHDTINSLNRNQKHCLIRFLGDGNGLGIRWELNFPGVMGRRKLS